VPGEKEPRGGLSEAQSKSMADAIEALKQAGAIIVDPVEIQSVMDPDPKNTFLAWGTCGGPKDVKGTDQDCSVVLKHGMKRDFNAWLASIGPAAPVKTLAELRAFNLAHASRNAIKYAQANLDVSDEMDVEKDKARWEADRAKDVRLAGTKRHRRGDAEEPPGRAALPGRERRGDFGEARLPDGDRPVWPGRARGATQPAAVPRRLHAEARPVWRELRRDGVQRAAPHRTGLRVRTGHQEAGAAAKRAVATDTTARPTMTVAANRSGAGSAPTIRCDGRDWPRRPEPHLG